jgi:excisionase family DNA binding protein
MANSHSDYYWTPAEAASALRVSLNTIYNLIRDKRIPSIHVGGQYRIDRQAITRATVNSASRFHWVHP